MKKIIEVIFGIRKDGEPIEIKKVNREVKELNFPEFEKWCKEFNVGCRTDKTKFSFIN
jgi:hypothetical protein